LLTVEPVLVIEVVAGLEVVVDEVVSVCA